jgi:hypothetical protein
MFTAVVGGVAGAALLLVGNAVDSFGTALQWPAPLLAEF